VNAAEAAGAEVLEDRTLPHEISWSNPVVRVQWRRGVARGGVRGSAGRGGVP
jgi:hypothetical protein